MRSDADRVAAGHARASRTIASAKSAARAHVLVRQARPMRIPPPIAFAIVRRSRARARTSTKVPAATSRKRAVRVVHDRPANQNRSRHDECDRAELSSPGAGEELARDEEHQDGEPEGGDDADETERLSQACSARRCGPLPARRGRRRRRAAGCATRLCRHVPAGSRARSPARNASSATRRTRATSRTARRSTQAEPRTRSRPQPPRPGTPRASLFRACGVWRRTGSAALETPCSHLGQRLQRPLAVLREAQVGEEPRHHDALAELP